MFERLSVPEDSVESATVQSTLQAALGASYALERELGRGGMATVYLARDVRHRRAVAVKVLHPDLSAVLGSERFLREIELTAALQHPHILPLFDSGTSLGLLYYVMPFVEGETLRARLARARQLGVDEAVRIAADVAGALDYAHRHGVVHRDLKPENILLQDGLALVADFGVARAVEHAADAATLTSTGLTVGTPAYMSPEQAAGERELDGRSDVFALGCVLYEMLAGAPPFAAPTPQGVIARVIAEEPRPLTAARPSVPSHVEHAVRRALAKMPADRFASAAAFAAALGSGPGLATPATPVATSGMRAARLRSLTPRTTILLAGTALTVAAALGWAAGRTSRAKGSDQLSRAPVRFIIQPDSGSLGSGSWWYSAPAISPDGRTVVYAALEASGARLYARRVDDVAARPLAGTEDGDWPFFSPDGQWVGFASRGVIRKVRLAGGTPVVVAAVPTASVFFGGSWGTDDTIVFTVITSGALHRVSASGGVAIPIPVADTTQRLMHPHPLPGGRALLVTASRDWRVGRVAVLELATGRLRRFGPGTGARYIAGHIVYAGASGELFRQPFDLTRMAPNGSVEEIASALDVSYAAYSPFDVSPSGALVYRVSPGAWKLTVTDREGRAQQVLPARAPWSPRFSPDGRRVAYAASAPGQESGDLWSSEVWQSDIWITDLASGTMQRLTTDGNDNNEPLWSPDGRWIAYDAGLVFGGKDLYVRAVDDDSVRLLSGRPADQITHSWAPDGSAILFREPSPGGDHDIWIQPVDGGAARPYLTGPGDQREARVAPSGRWVAYTSNETGHDEVYLQSYPTSGRKLLVSSDGGVDPAWRADGRELYYWRGDQLVAATMDAGAVGEPPVVRARTHLFRGPRVEGAGYDVSPDGTQFILVSGGPRASRLVVALNALGADRARKSDGR